MSEVLQWINVLVSGATLVAFILASTDPCSGVAKTSIVFSISTATTTELVNASASNKLYVCAMNLVTAAANNVALVEDDSDACASPSAGMAGGARFNAVVR